MWFPESKSDRYTTCSDECRTVKMDLKLKDRRRVCSTCGVDFYPRQEQLRHGSGIYCSQKCNTSGRKAMNADEAQIRAAATRVANKDKWVWKLSGSNSKIWRGGKKATYERRKAAGAYRDMNNKRRDFRRRSLPKGFIPMLEKLQKMRCASCRKSLIRGYHLDHIHPISKGGAHAEGNVQLLCPPCNMEKRDMTPQEWATKKGRLI